MDLNGPRQEPKILWRERAFRLAYWNEQGQEKESLLHAVMEFLLPRKYLIAMDQGWSDWDLEICQGPWAKAQIKTATENHTGQNEAAASTLAPEDVQDLGRMSLDLFHRSWP